MQAEVQELVAIRRTLAEMEEAFDKAATPYKEKRDALQAQITEEPR